MAGAACRGLVGFGRVRQVKQARAGQGSDRIDLARQAWWGRARQVLASRGRRGRFGTDWLGKAGIGWAWFGLTGNFKGLKRCPKH